MTTCKEEQNNPSHRSKKSSPVKYEKLLWRICNQHVCKFLTISICRWLGWFCALVVLGRPPLGLEYFPSPPFNPNPKFSIFPLLVKKFHRVGQRQVRPLCTGGQKYAQVGWVRSHLSVEGWRPPKSWEGLWDSGNTAADQTWFCWRPTSQISAGRKTNYPCFQTNKITTVLWITKSNTSFYSWGIIGKTTSAKSHSLYNLWNDFLNLF